MTTQTNIIFQNNQVALNLGTRFLEFPVLVKVVRLNITVILRIIHPSEFCLQLGGGGEHIGVLCIWIGLFHGP